MTVLKNITELQGKAGQGFGDIVIPIQGKTSMQIQPDFLYIRTKLSYELESVETFIRLSKIDSVSLGEGRSWWLLWLGFSLLFAYFIGVIFIILFFVNKHRWIAVHSASKSYYLFFQNSEINRAKQFTQSLLNAMKQSSAPKLPKKPPTQPQKLPSKPE